MTRHRRVPHRLCINCRQARPKRELVRIVRTPEGGVQVDETGKRSGRGAYVCRNRACWSQALGPGGPLGRALRCEIPTAVREALMAYSMDLPEAAESDGAEGR